MENLNKKFNFTKKNGKTKQIESVGDLRFNSTNNERAELRFYGDIVSNSWQSYWYEEDKCPQDIVDFLADLDGFKAVDIYINSGGGSVHGGLAIYNILKRYSGEKTVHVDGIAASIASVIALAGDRTIIPSTAQFMIHKPWSVAMGDANDMRKEADALDSCQKAITEVYLKNAREGITVEQLTEMIDRETWLTGAEATQYFNVESEEVVEVMACESDYFDRYEHVPKGLRTQEICIFEKEDNLKEKLQLELELLSL